MATAVIPAAAQVRTVLRDVPSRREPHSPEVVVAENAARVRLQALDLLRHAVDVVCVRPAHVPALLVLDLLNLAPVGLCLRLVKLADRLEQQRVPRWVVPVRLV